MSNIVETNTFNQNDRLIEGWYWLLSSRELKIKGKKAVNLWGRELVVYRGESGQAYALDAYCPHMGAHLSQGDVQGEDIRCFFHHWSFDCKGSCVKIPAQSPSQSTSFVPKIPSWPVEEKYGIIWIWTGSSPRQPVPYVPELKGMETDWLHGNRFTKDCHPNVVMINAIDAQHFNSVHPLSKKLAGNLNLEPTVINENNIEFRNVTPVPQDFWFGKLLAKFYDGPLRYAMSYWYASTGSVTVGPDFQRFHIIFALRPTVDGKAQGQTILVTKKRSGLMGKIYNRLILRITQVVGNYFAKGDTLIFKLIQFKMQAPIRADHAIIRFIQHADAQRISVWKSKDKTKNVSTQMNGLNKEVETPCSS